MGDDDENVVRRVLRDPQGNLRPGRLLDAIRGRGSSDPDLVPWLGALLVGSLGIAAGIGFIDYGTVAGAVDMLWWGVLWFAILSSVWVTERVERYYEGDEELALEQLRARYTRGELTLEEFQQQVDVVYGDDPALGSDDDSTDWLAVRALVDPRGNLRPGRLLDAIRGRGSDHGHLVPQLVAVLLGGGALGGVAGYLEYGTVAGALEMGGMFLVAAVLFVAFMVSKRVERYHQSNEELALEQVRARYAHGALTREEFRRQVDRVHEEGPEVVLGDDEEDPPATGTGAASAGDDRPATDEDPVAILRRRFAQGELSEDEYRSRVAALAETGVDVAGIAEEPDPERAGE
jgi:uncharacterized membrane protein